MRAVSTGSSLSSQSTCLMMLKSSPSAQLRYVCCSPGLLLKGLVAICSPLIQSAILVSACF